VITAGDYLSAIAADGAALVAAAADHLEVAVPSCPGWDLAELVRHTGNVHRHKVAVIEVGGTQRPKVGWASPPAGGRALLTWYREGLALLLDRLGTFDPETPAWSWTGDHRVAFWQRRMAQETLVHRWDAQAAVGDIGPVESELAADGVDEWLRVFLPDPDGAYEGAPGTIHLHRTDGEGEWLVELSSWPPVVSDGHAKGGAAVRGSAEQLLLFLWGRRPNDTVEVHGDPAMVDSLLAAPQL
jgi:uncharacterized protein (TIGR03083 family)